MAELSVKQYADEVGISTTAVYKKIEAGLLKCDTKNGKKVVIVDDLEDLKPLETKSKEIETNLKYEINNLNFIIKTLEQDKEDLKLELKEKDKRIAKKEKSLNKKDKRIERLEKQVEKYLKQVLKESEQTKEIYSQFFNKVLPQMTNTQKQDEEIIEADIEKTKKSKKKKKNKKK